jgi:enoyl-[acyl-carrier protein] reductase II
MKNRVCEVLGIEKPILGAAMSWTTDAKWVAAISNAGGMGILGPNCGATEMTDSPEETGERLRREIRKTRELTDKPFAVNYLLPIEGIESTYTFAKPVYLSYDARGTSENCSDQWCSCERGRGRPT